MRSPFVVYTIDHSRIIRSLDSVLWKFRLRSV
jgi:hypothetical protein